MKISRVSLAIAGMLSLFSLCSGCATQHLPSASIPAGQGVAHATGPSTIPAGPSAGPAASKHFTGQQ